MGEIDVYSRYRIYSIVPAISYAPFGLMSVRSTHLDLVLDRRKIKTNHYVH